MTPLNQLKKAHRDLKRAFQNFWLDVAYRRPKVSMGFYYPNAKGGASYRADSLYERCRAGDILGFETVVTADSDGDLQFHFRKKLPDKPDALYD